MSSEHLLNNISNVSDETEFYTPRPAGYREGKTKYVVVVGSVMSGLGKGIFSSSLAKILKDKGLTVAPVKLEGYLNLDSGTLNPYRHGEVFVLDDGMECDMDLGTYERMLDQNLSRRNFVTSGQIFNRVLEKERLGGYLGRDVLMIPHVTGEVKLRLRELAVESDADVVFVEIGGTVGDVENAYYFEAMRELAFEEGPDSACFVVLTYIIEPPALGEQKSKAAQLGIRALLECGIQPHIVACRGRHRVTQKVREKLAMYTNVPLDRVISMHDCESIYLIPEMLRGAGMDTAVVDILKLHDRVHPEAEQKARATWSDLLRKQREADTEVTIGIAGKYTSVRDSYASVIKALEHSGAHAGVRVNIDWIDTTDLTEANVAEQLGHLNGLLLPGGFGVRGAEGKIVAVRFAREHRIPFLGICFGFQLAVVEFARNVCGLAGANSREIVPDCPHPVIDILPEQKAIEGLGGNMRLGGRDVSIKAGTRAHQLFNFATEVRMRFRHRWEVEPKYIERLEAGGLVFSGKAPDYPIMQVLELPADAHPYFLATQAHAEMTSRPLRPDPLYLGLVRAAIENKHPMTDDASQSADSAATGELTTS
ncbi:MAG: CTP synthase [Phycisphaerae bacterium]|nr:CTP synthase [Phycisphaerae bacterium]NUQ46043.1 CTP synthase [Phycisphaerae bacterium]